MHCSGDALTGVQVIRKIVAGLHLSGSTGTGMAMIIDTVAGWNSFVTLCTGVDRD